MGITTGCFIRALPGLQAYDGLTIANWFINKKEDRLAIEFLVAAKIRTHEALKADLMGEEAAQTIMKGIDDTLTALDDKDYTGAADKVTESAVKAIDEAMQQAIECEIGR